MATRSISCDLGFDACYPAMAQTMKVTLLIGSMAMLLSTATHAVGDATCASPTPLASLWNYPTGTTCDGEIGINMGGVVYGHPSRVYSFRVNQPGSSGTISLTGTNREAVVTRSCTEAPVAISAPGFLVDTSALGEGEWLYVISTDPSLPVTSPPTCGPYSALYYYTGPDDRIFADGFS